MYLKYRSSSGVQTPVLNIAQIPTLTLAKLPTIPYSKQGVAILWNSNHLLSNGDVYALSASAASYKWLEFDCMYEDGVWLPTFRVYSPNGKTVDLHFGTAIGGQLVPLAREGRHIRDEGDVLRCRRNLQRV